MQHKPQLKLIRTRNLRLQILTVQLSTKSRVGFVPVNDDPCPQNDGKCRKTQGDYRIALKGSRLRSQRFAEASPRAFALHSLGPADVSALKWLFERWLWVTPASECSRWKALMTLKAPWNCFDRHVRHHRGRINNAFISCGSDLQKKMFVFNYLIQYESETFKKVSDWPVMDSICMHAPSTHMQVWNLKFRACFPFRERSKLQHSNPRKYSTKHYNTDCIKHHQEPDRRLEWDFIRCTLQASKFSPAPIRVCKLIISP